MGTNEILIFCVAILIGLSLLLGSLANVIHKMNGDIAKLKKTIDKMAKDMDIES